MNSGEKGSRGHSTLREISFVLLIAGILLAVRYRHVLVMIAAVAVPAILYLACWAADFYAWFARDDADADKKDRSSDLANLVP